MSLRWTAYAAPKPKGAQKRKMAVCRQKVHFTSSATKLYGVHWPIY